MTTEQLDQLTINTIRTLSIDAVQQANSGHPGTPMALAPLVYTIWNRVLRFDPQDPIWGTRVSLGKILRKGTIAIQMNAEWIPDSKPNPLASSVICQMVLLCDSAWFRSSSHRS
jgi:transketolase N-terminal domain/subunit